LGEGVPAQAIHGKQLKMTDDDLMAAAFEEAARAGERGEVPVGAAVADSSGRILARDGNRIIERRDPTAHAEMIVLRQAARSLGNERLLGTTLCVTLEPCSMCTGAISLARVERLVFAAEDPKGGAVLHGPRFFEQPTCHHRPVVARAGDAAMAGELLKDFFRARRA
jgi:tRNA(adenine34) deaminase